MATMPHSWKLKAAVGMAVILWSGTAAASQSVINRVTAACAGKTMVVDVNDCATCHGPGFTTMNTSNMYWNDSASGFYDTFCPAPVVDPVATTTDPTTVTTDPFATDTDPFATGTGGGGRKGRNGDYASDDDPFGDDPFDDGDDEGDDDGFRSERNSGDTGTVSASGRGEERRTLRGDNGKHKGRD